jgi:hypothetical protein
MKSIVHSFHTGRTSPPKEEASQQEDTQQETQGKTNKNKKPDENPTCVLEWTTITLDQFH